MAQGKQTGRILPHQHDKNDVAPIINGGTAINAEHAAAMFNIPRPMKLKTKHAKNTEGE
jgi:hypothetical protein